MKVYRGIIEITDVKIDNKTQLKQALQGEDVIQANFTLDSFFEFKIGDYIYWRAKKYTIFKQPSINKIKANEFQYNFDLESDQYRLLDALYMLDGISDFYLLGDVQKFIQLMIDNLNRLSGVNYYQLGKIPETDVKNLSFQNVNCFNTLQRICTEFSVEYSFSSDGKTIDIVNKIGHDTGLKFEFRTGLKNIERQKVNDKDIVTRLYAFGSERNLGPEYKSKKLKVDPIEKNIDIFGIIEGVVNFENIYPHREGSVTSVVIDNIYKFSDTTLDFDINKFLIAGLTAKVTFNSGYLSGYEFEISNYKNSTKEFSIIPYEDSNGLLFPNDTLKPVIGDKYVVHDIKMPQIYISNAERDLRQKSIAYLDENSLPNVIYNILPDEAYLRINVIELNVGDLIKIEDSDFKISYLTRILSLTQSLTNPHLYSIKVGDKYTISYINRVLSNQLEINNTIAIDKYDRTVQYNQIRRNLRNVTELNESIFDPDGYFNPEKIKPLSIETSMLSVGTKGQQFIIRNLLIESNYNGNKDNVKCGDGVLVHFTIDPDDVKEWNLSGSVINIPIDNSFYYIYAKCSKTTNTGVFDVTETQFKTNEYDYYYFLIGVVHSVIDNVRGISLTYGQTSINGKFITTGKITSSDGYNYIDLDKNKIVFGDADSYFDWNNRKPGKLVLNDAEIDNSLMVKNLWAEEATIADWHVKNGKITSINEYNSKPRAQLDGFNGSLKLISPKNIYSESGSDNEYEHTIELDSINGKIEARHTGDANQDSGVSILDSEGIFANFAGIHSVPPSTGVLLKSSIVGLGKGKLENNAYTGSNAICGIFGMATNTATNPTDTFGGFFLELMAYGLHIKTTVVQNTLYPVTKYDVYLSCYNLNQLIIKLPASPQKGRVIYVKRVNEVVTVIGNGNDLMIQTNVTNVIIKDGDLWMFVWDGSFWMANTMLR